VYLFRAASLVEGIALQYDPYFNGVKYATPLVKRLLTEIAFSGDKPLKTRLIDGATEAVTTARELMVVIHRLEREQLQLRVHEADLRSLERYLNAFLRRLLLGLALAMLAIITAIVAVQWQLPVLLVTMLAVILLLFAIITLIPLPRGGNNGNGPYLK
jgi:predicted unusual protein kinase regulating ubiquinone biosynthesis (AarF/ABC1/UbiB family)